MEKLIENIQSIIYGGLVGYIVFFGIVNWVELKEVLALDLDLPVILRYALVFIILALSLLQIASPKNLNFIFTGAVFVTAILSLLIYFFSDIPSNKYEYLVYEDFIIELICLFVFSAIITLVSNFYKKRRIKGSE